MVSSVRRSAVESVTADDTSPLAQFAFPRTGKRGVPQQFPRRLYEMLDCETKRCRDGGGDNIDYARIISWSASGKAFRIHNVAEFAEIVLPKYFRTKKFSSFQRNLNLYGFTKVRRGVDTDMYAHPSFLRDRPDGLLQLHKIIKSSRHRCVSVGDDFASSSDSEQPTDDASTSARPVSPPQQASQVVVAAVTPISSPSRVVKKLCQPEEPSSSSTSSLVSIMSKTVVMHGFNNDWIENNPYSPRSVRSPSVASVEVAAAAACCSDSDSDSSTNLANCRNMGFGSSSDKGRGKLDLLALALERECFAK